MKTTTKLLSGGGLRKTAWNIVENIPKFNPFRTKIFSPEEVRAFLDGTKKTWRIYLSGGEPFIYPNFIETVKELTQNHRVVLYTNLSTQIDRLVKEIDPKKIDFVYASLHWGERR
ncbi:MAG: hypothetical protein GF332_01510 [Candidatus Moranbacteria bacterium]|nr:hypothetical protein [Candidatus Moranbacteria bacterium]